MPASAHKFGDFELDPSRFELRCNDRVLKLERIPMELLLFLVEKDGAIVPRQEIVDRIWGKDVFVDTEHGINTAIRKIRQALKDDPENPRFVQTITGKGYRFIGESNGHAPVAAPAAAGLTEQSLPPAPPHPVEVQPPSAVQPSEARQKTPSPTIFAAALTTLALAAMLFAFRARIFPGHAAKIHSIAILPLVNLSGDASQDYFADGMTDELTTALAKNRNLRVASRTSAMQYKGVKRPLPEIARELNVDGILEGSIERSADRVHMTVQLIYAPTDSHIWAESYDRNSNQAYSLPEELSQTIAKEVKIATSAAPPQRYISPEAYDAYLHGRYFWFSTLDPRPTLPYFQKAIQLQPDYAAAWSGLADTYALQAMGMADIQPVGVSEKVHDAAAKALELDPLLPEAHNSMAAWYLFYAWDPTHAEAEARRGIELNPNYSELHHVLSYILEVENRYAEGEAETRRAVELDPYIHPWEYGTYLIGEHKYDEAINEFKMQIAAHPEDANMSWGISKVYWLKGMYNASQEAYERGLELQNDPKAKAEVHRVWLAGGEPAVERWGANRLTAYARHHYVESYFVATVIALTGDKDETMKYLEAGYRDHDPDIVFLQTEPAFDFLHADPRYQALVKKLALTPAY